MVDRLAQFIVKKRLLVLVCLALSTAFWLYHAVQTPIKSYFPDLLPEHAYTDLYKKYQTFGGANTLLVEIKAKKGDIFEYRTLEKIIMISETLKLLPGVDRNKVYSIGVPKVKNFMVTAWGLEYPSLMYPKPPDTEEGMQALKRNIYSNTLYYGKMVSLDGTSALISAEFFDEGVDYGEIYRTVQALVGECSDEDTELYVEGDPYLYGTINHYLGQTAMIFLATVLAMVLIAYIYTRSVRLVLVPLFSAIVCAIWGMGFMNLLHYNLDPLTLVIPLLISARALSHSIQFNWRINEEVATVGSVKTACRNSIVALFYPGLSGIITDGAGILLIAFIPVPLLAKLGIMSFVWCMSMIFVVLILNPVIYLYLPTMKNVVAWRDARKRGVMERTVLEVFSAVGRGKGAWGVLSVAVILALGAFYMSLDLKVGDMQPGTPLLKADSQYNRDSTHIGETFPGLMDPFLILATTTGDAGIKSPELMTKMAQFEYYMMMQPSVKGAISIIDLMENLNMKLHENNPKFYYVPETKRGIYTMLFFLMSGGAEPGDFDRYYTPDEKAANIAVYCKDHTTDTIKEVLDAAKKFISKSGSSEEYKFELATGRVGIIAATNESVEKDQTLILIAAFAITFLLCAFFLKSFMAGFLLILSLGLANLFTFAYMAFANIGITLQTLPVSTIAVGIGVDYGIYLMARIKEAFEEKGDLDAAIDEALKTAGNAVTATGLIIIAGVIFWNFSTIKFQADMGLLLSVVTFFHVLGTLLVIPALIRVVKPSFIVRCFQAGKVVNA